MDHSRVSIPWTYRVRSWVHAARRKFTAADEFDWQSYPTHYRAEINLNRRQYTDDLALVEWAVVDGHLLFRADNKPLHPGYLCVFEAVLNLQPSSVSEIGMGGGRYLAGLRRLLVRPIPPTERPQVVLASTVLMHIQRPDAYRRALEHLLASTTRYAVILDNYAHHSYFDDLSELAARVEPSPGLYVYDTGRTLAIVVSVDGAIPPGAFRPLASASQLLDRVS